MLHTLEDVSDMIPMYDVKEIQRVFNCSKNTAYNLMNSPGFPTVKIGRRLYVEKDALEGWLKRNRGKEFLT